MSETFLIGSKVIAFLNDENSKYFYLHGSKGVIEEVKEKMVSVNFEVFQLVDVPLYILKDHQN